MARHSDTDAELDLLDSSGALPIDVPAGVRAIQTAKRTHYVPATEMEQVLDKSINLKYDVFVVVVLAMDMFLQRINMTNVGYAQIGSGKLYTTLIVWR
jgi:hypothetical protein